MNGVLYPRFRRATLLRKVKQGPGRSTLQGCQKTPWATNKKASLMTALMCFDGNTGNHEMSNTASTWHSDGQDKDKGSVGCSSVLIREQSPGTACQGTDGAISLFEHSETKRPAERHDRNYGRVGLTRHGESPWPGLLLLRRQTHRDGKTG